MPKTAPEVALMLGCVSDLITKYRHEFILPEHMLLAMLRQGEFRDSLHIAAVDWENIEGCLKEFLDNIEKVPSDVKLEIMPSVQSQELMDEAYEILYNSSTEEMRVPHIVEAMLKLSGSYAKDLLSQALGDNKAYFMSVLISKYENISEIDQITGDIEPYDICFQIKDFNFGEPRDFEGEKKEELDAIAAMEEEPAIEEYLKEEQRKKRSGKVDWKSLVTCVNEIVDKHNPLIGREAELERTIQVLCRKEKNNPLHVGEPGVGKTALVYGLAKRINDGNVPDRLKDCLIYMMDVGGIVAGTQYRGDLEKRVKVIMEGATKEGNVIMYIDEIHTIVGAGEGSDGSLDMSNMLKPYLEKGDIRFIGSTTYEEFNRYFLRNKGLARRFQQIDIGEPSIEETINILKQLKRKYEKFHKVYYASDALEYAVRASAKYVNDRFLPDKAIDLMDEAGAFREMHPITTQKRQTVGKQLMAQLLSKICKIDAEVMKEENNSQLESLESRILSSIYGQDKAVGQVAMAIQMAKAGLSDDTKPLASLLFVGPTGVGKTEVAKVLAAELGIALVRFDMSEYTEKHTVAKLIGSPAGYVGYEDGGLLTDAIRKTPNCVLLLDEIEKAHSDIYNILLQVMDYASLTDNKGRKASFRNVILLITSNAGAQYAHQASMGFGQVISAGEAMMTQVKKTFKPEFINRLSGIVVFNDMDSHMAGLILDKKLRELQNKLDAKKISMTLSDDARQYLLEKGFTKEYGAREIERVINSELKPLLMREILYGKLKKGGVASVVMADGILSLK